MANRAACRGEHTETDTTILCRKPEVKSCVTAALSLIHNVSTENTFLIGWQVSIETGRDRPAQTVLVK